jgi:signal transduction histidine kinase/CheY-like chemotaxis protein
MSYKIKVLNNQQYSELISKKDSILFTNKIRLYLTTILPGLYFSVTDKIISQHNEKFLFVPNSILNANYPPDIFDNIVYKKFELNTTSIPFDEKIFVPVTVDGIVVGGIVCDEDYQDRTDWDNLINEFSISEYFSLIFNINDRLASGDAIALQMLNLMSAKRAVDSFMRAIPDWLVEFLGGGLASFYYKSGGEYVLRKMSGQGSYYGETPSYINEEDAKIFNSAIADGRFFLPAGVLPNYITEIAAPPPIRFIMGGKLGSDLEYLLTGVVPNITSYSFALFFQRFQTILEGLSEKHFSSEPIWHRIFSTLNEMSEAGQTYQKMFEFLYPIINEHVNINRLGMARYNQFENRFEIESDVHQFGKSYFSEFATLPVSGSDLEYIIRTGKFHFKSIQTPSINNKLEYQAYKEGARSILMAPISFNGNITGVLGACSPMTDDHLKKNVNIFETIADYIGKLFAIKEFRRTADIHLRQSSELQGKLASLENLRILGELAGGVFHDLNNVLAAILGRCQILQGKVSSLPESELVNKMMRDLSLIEKSAIDSGEILNRLRQLSQSRRGGSEQVITVLEIIDDSIEMVKPRWERLSQEKGLKIVLKKDVPDDIKIKVDPASMREVFTNLLLNSLDAFSSSGEIGISCRQVKERVSIFINDNASGIPQDIIDKIFDPFFTTKGEKGTGLGLSLSKKIIESHGGQIEANSTLEKGTKFIIELPVFRSDEIQPEKKYIPSIGRKRSRVLIIEDRSEMKDILQESLAEHGYDVSVTSSGEEAIATLGKAKFDALIVDLGLPGISGLELAGQIKGFDRKIRIILISGWEIEQSISDLMSIGIDSVMTKPFKLEAILETLSNLLEQKEEVDSQAL